MKTKIVRLFIALVIISLAASLSWLATTDHPAIWPVKNTLQYRLYVWLGNHPPPSAEGKTGALQGRVTDSQNRPIAGAWVLLARRNGVTFSSRSNEAGDYEINNIPPGIYRPVAGAPGYQSVQFGGLFNRVNIKAGQQARVNAVLPVEPERAVSPGQNFRLAEPATLTCSSPLQASAVRRQIHFTSAGQPNQPAFYYTPVTTTTTSPLPVLLTVYPGPADSWECASLPLAAAGYAVIATGPTYSFDLESDVDELIRILDFVRQGEFPGSDGRQIALLGGSYSSLHVQLLLQRATRATRAQPVKAALLLGPPTDLFDMRRRLENGSYVPPFGLDQALIALGFPDQAPLRYFRYSGAYHVRGNFPPLAILHSRTDEVVPFQQSELLANNLQLAGATYEIYFFDGASHYLLAENGDEDTLKIYQITLDFLAKHLK